MPQPKASSGHKLIFTEDESILLTDKNGNVIKLDTQGKNIKIEGDLHSETKKGKTMINSEGGIESNSVEMINLNAEGKIHGNSNENTKFS